MKDERYGQGVLHLENGMCADGRKSVPSIVRTVSSEKQAGALVERLGGDT